MAAAAAAILAACTSTGSTSQVTPWGPAAAPRGRAVGLGRVLTTKNGGQIFGFDIDQKGNDGVLATAADVETFGQDSGRIRKSFPKRAPYGTTYSMDGIFSGDVALVTRYVVPPGQIYAKRH
ncbi:MAG TPA: hypothetical protein VF778_07185, partial [Xanthobacteraceae bacterium]